MDAEPCILITGAGTAATSNLLRSLRAGDPSLVTVGCHHDRFKIKTSTAARNYLTPPLSNQSFPDVLRRIVDKEKVDLIIPNSDHDIQAISVFRDALTCRLFLPDNDVLNLCQDKFILAERLQSRGVPVPRTYCVNRLDEIGNICKRLEPHRQLWCRLRTGSNARGALKINDPEQAKSWISYWHAMRGVTHNQFTISEYLPGRDYISVSIWDKGTLVLIKTFQRLAYFGGDDVPTSVSSLAKTVVDHRIVEISVRAIRAADDKPRGVFSVDLKEDLVGDPRVTEINAGRFVMAMNAFDVTGQYNMAKTFLRLALGQGVEFSGKYDAVDDYYVVRDFDMMPAVFHSDEFFQDIEEMD